MGREADSFDDCGDLDDVLLRHVFLFRRQTRCPSHGEKKDYKVVERGFSVHDLVARLLLFGLQDGLEVLLDALGIFGSDFIRFGQRFALPHGTLVANLR